MERLNLLKSKVQEFTDNYDSDEIEYKKVVLYDGSPNASIMCVARDLGEEEYKLGRVLIGTAGQLFRKVIKHVGLNPDKDLFLCNTVPLKPKRNIVFSSKVREDYKWVLNELFYIVRPKYIMTLGLEALQSIHLFDKVSKLGPYIGAVFKVKGVEVFPNWHPSFICRCGGLYSPKGKEFINVVENLYQSFCEDLGIGKENLL